MKKNIGVCLWVLLCLSLIVVNVIVFQTTRPPVFAVKGAEVDYIKYRLYQSNGLKSSEIPTEFEEQYRKIENREDIERICDVLSTLYIKEYPMDSAEDSWRAWATFYTYDSCFVFYMTDGTTRVFNGALGHLIAFDEHWCYATGGEKYGYQPLSSLLMDELNNATYSK